MTKSINGISVIAGYSYNDTRYTSSNIYSKNDRLKYNPAHTANASIYYAFNSKNMLRGFNVGAGFFMLAIELQEETIQLQVLLIS
jgi:iron complex outermembrane receptor protein